MSAGFEKRRSRDLPDGTLLDMAAAGSTVGLQTRPGSVRSQPDAWLSAVCAATKMKRSRKTP